MARRKHLERHVSGRQIDVRVRAESLERRIMLAGITGSLDAMEAPQSEATNVSVLASSLPGIVVTDSTPDSWTVAAGNHIDGRVTWQWWNGAADPSAQETAVLGICDSSGRWVSGTTPWVLLRQVLNVGTPNGTWWYSYWGMGVPSTPGVYRLVLAEIPSSDDADAIAKFESNSEVASADAGMISVFWANPGVTLTSAVQTWNVTTSSMINGSFTADWWNGSSGSSLALVVGVQDIADHWVGGTVPQVVSWQSPPIGSPGSSVSLSFGNLSVPPIAGMYKLVLAVEPSGQAVQAFEASADVAEVTLGTITATQSSTVWGPLLPFPTWNQSGLIGYGSSVNYNDYCPIDPATGSRSITGCVATAMAEILYYWHTPASIAFGAADAYTSNAGTASQVNIDSDSAKYSFPSFSSLSSGLSALQYDGDPAEMALLAFGLGIKCQAGYSSSGTGAGWSTGTFKNLGFAAATWSGDWNAAKPAVIANIQAGEPVYLNVPGHLTVIDGYDSGTDRFHIVLGWGGFDDDWYTLPGTGNFPGSTTPETVACLCYNLYVANRIPTNIDLSSTSVPEQQPVGTVVGMLQTTDPDPGGSFTYSLVSGIGGTDNASFTISGNQLRTAAVFDYEAKSSYSIRIRSTDKGGLWFETVLTITVANVDEAPTSINLSGTSVAENQPVGTVVGNLATSDPDSGDTFTYSLVPGFGSTDNSSFSIRGNQLLTATTLNYDLKNSYSIRIRTTDSGGLFIEETFIVSITNVLQAPTDVALSSTSVADIQPVDTPVGTLSTTDPDIGDTFTYSLVSGADSADNGSFAINGDWLQTAEVFNAAMKNSYSVRIRTTDSSGLWFEKAFAITVVHINRAPTDLALDNTSLAENQPLGTVVGTLSTTDPDSGDTFTYSLVPGSGSTNNGSFTISGNALNTAAVFDYEARKNYSIRIRTTDTGRSFTEKVFAISVTDVNEAPTSMQLSPKAIAENVPLGTTVGNLSVSDPDVGETYSYEILLGVDQSAFSIVGDQLKTAVNLDYETKRSYAITVRVHDGVNIFDQALLISVTNVNEAPTGITLSNALVAENLAAGTVVGTLATIDPDTAETYNYEILSGSDATAFSLTGNQLKTAASFDYESKDSYSITVRVHDGINTLDQPFTIFVSDVNEPPTNMAFSRLSVPENQPIGTVVGTLTTTDPDSGESTSYEILPGADSASFAIVDNRLTTAAVFDYESKVNYSITVRAHDGGNSLDKPFTIAVTDLVEFGLQQGKTKPVTIPDAGGDLVTFKLTGGGSGTIQPDNSITLAGTTLKSVLTISVKKAGGGDGLYDLPGITSDGLLQSINATAVTLSGEVQLNTLNQIPGKAAVSLKVREISDADIQVQGMPVTSIAVGGSVTGSRISSTGSIGKFTATALLDSDILVGVTTDFAGQFAGSTDDFANAAAKLGSLTVAGKKLPKGSSYPAYVNGVHLSAPSIGTLKLANVDSTVQANVLSDTGTLTITAMNPLASGVSVLTAGTWKAGKAGRPAVVAIV